MRIAVVLPAPLWPSRPRTVPGRDVEIEVAQGPEVAEALAEAAGRDPAGRLRRPAVAGHSERHCRMLYV